jgi:hypothetical protein
MADLPDYVTSALDHLARLPTLPANYDQLNPEVRARVRDEYSRRQRGLCPLCLQPLAADPSPLVQRLPVEISQHSRTRIKWPEAFFRHPVHLHHDHKTGLTIGAYHARCNAVLKAYFDE